MELLVVVAIIGIIGAIAYPSYMGYVTRANRTAAQSVLLQVADRQEQFFSNNKRYAANLTALGYPANPFAINNEGAVVAAADTNRVYSISLSNISATTFTANATPQLRQANQDNAVCGTLTLTHTALRGQTGPGSGCW